MENTEPRNPLVSVVVITYNSSKYVLETLESVKSQTYRNIELIVSDDCSTDDTVEICRNWLDANKDSFIRTELITVEKNTGIPANCNRGYKAGNGEWIKGIAGDDALLPNCVEDNIGFITKYPDAKIVHSKALTCRDFLDDSNVIEASSANEFLTERFTAKEQFKILSFQNTVFASTVFMERKTFASEGGYDETIRLCEDYPMWLKLTRNGIKFYYLDVVTVKYRIYTQSISRRKFFFAQVTTDIYNKYIRQHSTCLFRVFFMYNVYLTTSMEKIQTGMKINAKTTMFGRFCKILKLPFNCYFYFVKKKIKKHRT